MSDLPIFKLYPEPDSGVELVADKIDTRFLDPNFLMWKRSWDKFGDDLSIYWQSVLSGLGKIDIESLFNALASAAIDIGPQDPEQLSSEYSIPLTELSVDRRIINGNQCPELWLANGQVTQLDAATASRLSELNEYQFRFLQLAVTSGYLDSVVEEIPILAGLKQMAYSDGNPSWLKYGLRGLFLSIYPPSRVAQLQSNDEIQAVFVNDLDIPDQAAHLESIRRNGSKYMNLPNSERARQLTGHLSKIMHKLIVFTAKADVGDIPKSLLKYLAAADEISNVSAEVIANEFTKPDGHFKDLVENMAGHIADWYIARNLDDFHSTIPFSASDLERKRILFQNYFDDVGAEAKEMMDYIAELTGLDLLTIAETIVIDRTQLRDLKLNWNDDVAQTLRALGEYKTEITNWLLQNRNQNVTSVSLSFITMVRLLKSNPLRRVKGAILPSQPVPTAKGGHKFIDAAALSYSDTAPVFKGTELWQYLAESHETVDIIEVKARSVVQPQSKASQSDLEQVGGYVADLSALGVKVGNVHFAYLGANGNRLITLSVHELNQLRRLA